MLSVMTTGEVILIVGITIFVIIVLFSLWFIHNMDNFQPQRTGYGLQKATCSIQGPQQKQASHYVMCEINGQSLSQRARKRQAVVASKKKVTYSKLKPKIYVQEGSEMIELKDLGKGSLAKSSSKEELNFNVAQGIVEVHANDPVFKKVQHPKYRSDYQLVGTLNEHLDTISAECIPEEEEEDVNQSFPFKAEDIEKANKPESE